VHARIPRFRTNVVKLISPHQGTKSVAKEAEEAASGVRGIVLESAVRASPISDLSFIDELVIGFVDREGHKILRHGCEGCIVNDLSAGMRHS
jgi:hypothetical protein